MADETAIATTAVDIVFGGLAGAVVSYALAARQTHASEKRQAMVDAVEATRDDLLSELTWSFQLAESGRAPSGLPFGAAAFPDADRALIGDQALADECLAVMEEIFAPRVEYPAPLTTTERRRLSVLLEQLTRQFRSQRILARAGKAPKRSAWPL